MSREREFTREMAIALLNEKASHPGAPTAESANGWWSRGAVDAVISAHRLGAESVGDLSSLKSMANAWGKIHDALHPLAPGWSVGPEPTPVDNAVREIQRVYAENRKLQTWADQRSADHEKVSKEWAQIWDELTRQNPSFVETYSTGSQEMIIAELKRVYAECKRLSDEANRADAAEREIERLQHQIAALQCSGKVGDYAKPAPELKLTDISKPVQTRGGRKARIICTDFKGGTGEETMIALITDDQGDEYTTDHWADGRYMPGTDSDEDIVNVPEEPRSVTIFTDLRIDTDSKMYAVSRPNQWPDPTDNTIAKTFVEIEIQK